MSTHPFHENNSECCRDTVYADCPRLCGYSVNRERRGARQLLILRCFIKHQAWGCVLRRKPAQLWTGTEALPSSSCQGCNTVAQGWKISWIHRLGISWNRWSTLVSWKWTDSFSQCCDPTRLKDPVLEHYAKMCFVTLYSWFDGQSSLSMYQCRWFKDQALRAGTISLNWLPAL